MGTFIGVKKVKDPLQDMAKQLKTNMIKFLHEIAHVQWSPILKAF